MGSLDEPNCEKPAGLPGDLNRLSPGPTIVVDAEERIVAANELAGRLLRWDPAEFRGQPIEVLLAERGREIWSRVFSRCLGDPRDWPLGETPGELVQERSRTSFIGSSGSPSTPAGPLRAR